MELCGCQQWNSARRKDLQIFPVWLSLNPALCPAVSGGLKAIKCFLVLLLHFELLFCIHDSFLLSCFTFFPVICLTPSPHNHYAEPLSPQCKVPSPLLPAWGGVLDCPLFILPPGQTDNAQEISTQLQLTNVSCRGLISGPEPWLPSSILCVSPAPTICAMGVFAALVGNSSACLDYCK